MLNCRYALSHLEFGMWKKDCQEAFQHHVVEFGLGITQLNNTPGRNDCKVIRYFGVIKHTFVKLDVLLVSEWAAHCASG